MPPQIVESLCLKNNQAARLHRASSLKHTTPQGRTRSILPIIAASAHRYRDMMALGRYAGVAAKLNSQFGIVTT